MTFELTNDITARVDEALANEDFKLIEEILNGTEPIPYTDQVDLVEFIFEHDKILARKIFEGQTAIELSHTTLALAAFKGKNEEMVGILMRQPELQKKENREQVLTWAVTEGHELIKLFVEEIVDMFIETLDKQLITEHTAGLMTIEECFTF